MLRPGDSHNNQTDGLVQSYPQLDVLHIRAVGDPGLIVGDEPEFQDLLNTEIAVQELIVFFSREK